MLKPFEPLSFSYIYTKFLLHLYETTLEVTTNDSARLDTISNLTTNFVSAGGRVEEGLFLLNPSY